MAYAGVFGFAKALREGGETSMPTTDETSFDVTTEEGKLMGAAKKRNAIAMANMTMAFTSEGTIALVYEAMNDDWPGGLAHKVVSMLKKKYQPQDSMTKVELRKRLAMVSMKKKENPSTLFEQLSAIKNRYNTTQKKIEEEDLMAVVISAAPPEYQAVLTSVQLHLKDDMTMDDLSEAMSAYWRAIEGDNTKSEETGNEIGLITFGGTCFNCKQKGHKSHECPEKKARAKKTTQEAGAGGGSGG
jgi:hypothetical protein